MYCSVTYKLTAALVLLAWMTQLNQRPLGILNPFGISLNRETPQPNTNWVMRTTIVTTSKRTILKL